jgi:hypothetical protein
MHFCPNLWAPKNTSWLVIHPEIAPGEGRLTSEFFTVGLLKKKVYLGGMSILSILLSLEPGCQRRHHVSRDSLPPMCVSLSQTDNPLSNFILLRKDIILQVLLDLRDPCIETNLRRLTLCTEDRGRTHNEYDRWCPPTGGTSGFVSAGCPRHPVWLTGLLGEACKPPVPLQAQTHM